MGNGNLFMKGREGAAVGTRSSRIPNIFPERRFLKRLKFRVKVSLTYSIYFHIFNPRKSKFYQ